MTIRTRREIDLLRRKTSITDVTRLQYSQVERFVGRVASPPQLISALLTVVGTLAEQNRVDVHSTFGSLLIRGGSTEQQPGTTPEPIENWTESRSANEGVEALISPTAAMKVSRPGLYLVELWLSATGNKQIEVEVYVDGQPTGVSSNRELHPSKPGSWGFSHVLEIPEASIEESVGVEAYCVGDTGAARFTATSAQFSVLRVGERLD